MQEGLSLSGSLSSFLTVTIFVIHKVSARNKPFDLCDYEIVPLHLYVHEAAAQVCLWRNRGNKRVIFESMSDVQLTHCEMLGLLLTALLQMKITVDIAVNSLSNVSLGTSKRTNLFEFGGRWSQKSAPKEHLWGRTSNGRALRTCASVAELRRLLPNY